MMKGIFWNSQENRLRVLWRLVLHMLLIFLISIFFSIVLDSLYFLLLGSFNSDNRIPGLLKIFENHWINAMVFPGGMLLIILAATMISGRCLDRRKFKDFGFHFSKAWWLDLTFGLTLGAVLMGLIFLFGWGIGSIQITGFMQSFSGRGQILPEFLQGLIFYILVGFYEELLYSCACGFFCCFWFAACGQSQCFLDQHDEYHVGGHFSWAWDDPDGESFDLDRAAYHLEFLPGQCVWVPGQRNAYWGNLDRNQVGGIRMVNRRRIWTGSRVDGVGRDADWQPVDGVMGSQEQE